MRRVGRREKQHGLAGPDRQRPLDLTVSAENSHLQVKNRRGPRSKSRDSSRAGGRRSR